MKFKDLVITGGLFALTYLMGITTGIVKCTEGTSEILEKDHKLKINKVAYKPTGKVTRVEITKLDEEEKQEES